MQRQGRCDTYATEFDLEAEEYVPLPKGDVHKKKEIIQDVTLHDLDVANARPQVLPLLAPQRSGQGCEPEALGTRRRRQGLL